MRLKFGDVVLSAQTRELFRRGEPVHLAPKAFDLLLLLVSRRPNAVSKQEILSCVWPDTFVSDATLTALISDVRDAVGDDARAPRIIRTLHRFGYAFSVEAVEDPITPVPSEGPPLGWLIAESWRLPLHAGEVVLGREGEGVVPVPAASVSRRHAALVLEQGHAHLRDLGSKNGTFVDGERLAAPVTLKDGNRIRLGTFEAIYRAGDGATTETI
jgi:DNA-binding winged helix-turn-helix (wHTH) protein